MIFSLAAAANPSYLQAARRDPIDHETGRMPEDRQAEQDQARGLREFAERLVRQLGFEDAVDACRRNGWQGALNVMLEQKGSGKPAR